jgi:hypothetical protein
MQNLKQIFYRKTEPGSVPSAWRKQIAEAADNPNLGQRLLDQERQLLADFALSSGKLRALPRWIRRMM